MKFRGWVKSVPAEISWKWKTETDMEQHHLITMIIRTELAHLPILQYLFFLGLRRQERDWTSDRFIAGQALVSSYSLLHHSNRHFCSRDDNASGLRK